MVGKKCSVFSVQCSVALLAILCTSCTPPSKETDDVSGAGVPPQRYLVGAHCYLWFPENFKHGTLRGKLAPPQRRSVKDYNSHDPATAEQHIAWCSQYGIDFLTLDWWPNRPQQNAAITNGFLRAANIADIRFCIFYETWGLGFNKDYGCTELDDAGRDRLIEQLSGIADAFFDHPSYLRIAGRPVIVLYLTRTLTGQYAEAVAGFRERAGRMGFDPYIIGDEIFWKVSPLLDPGTIPHPLTDRPQPGRMGCFDAITAYNMYENGNTTQRGYGAKSTFVADVADCFRRFREAAGTEIDFVPSVIPGYNDRGVRRVADHYVIPRQWTPDGPEGSFLAESFERLAFPFIDPDINMILVTSWNEWNEDTAVEPLDPSPPVTRDRSRSGTAFTQGYRYTGYGTTYLEVIRDKVVAVCGRVVDADGQGQTGSRVTARQGPRRVTVTTDSRGYYRVPRGRILPGACSVRVRATGEVREVTVNRETTVSDVDFTM